MSKGLAKRSGLACLVLSAMVFPIFVQATFVQAATADRISGNLNTGATVALPGNVNHKALPKYDQGPADPGLRFGSVTLLTSPTPAQAKAMQELLAQQQDPKSPNYHKWLTPEQWADRFGLSPNDIAKITAWLKAQGFTIGYVARGRNWITFSGTAAQIEQTFGTQIHKFNVNGEKHVANATSPKIPAALAGIVTGIRGLDDFFLKPRAVRNVRPLYYDPVLNELNPAAPADFLAPGDIATIYDINALYNSGIDGTGQKLAIIGQTDIFITDINDFRTGFPGAFASGSISGCTCNGSNCATGVVTSCSTNNFQYLLVLEDGNTDPLTPSWGDLTESDLDLEWSMSVARNAQIILVNAPINGANGGVWQAWYYAVDNTTAHVISMSYGACEFVDPSGAAPLNPDGTPGPDEQELMKANSEGITFLNSSGDSGAAECPQVSDTDLAEGGLAVSYPASSPEVTGVGGTAIAYPTGFSSTYWTTTNASDGCSLTDCGSAQNPPLPEISWNDDEELETAYGDYGGTCPSGPLGWQECYAIVASGGGPSNCAEQTSDLSECVSGFPQPQWQTVIVPNQESVRLSPDVALLASPNFTGYIFCTPQQAWVGNGNTDSTCYSTTTPQQGIQNAIAFTYNGTNVPSLVGGTSASTPLFAGIVTLLNQYLGSSGGLGNINPMLYQLAQTPANGAYHEVDTGDNTVYCEPGYPLQPWPEALVCPPSGIFGYQASNADGTTGYNLVTGLGYVDADNLAIAWKAQATQAGFSLSASTATLSANSGGNSNSSTITITPQNGFSGTVTFSCPSGLPSGATCNFTANSATSSTLVIQTTACVTSATDTPVIITGTSGAVTSSIVVSLTVTAAGNYTVSASALSPASVSAGNSTTSTVTITPQSCFSGTVNLSCSGAPQDTSCSFSPASVSSSPWTSTLTMNTQPNAAAGTSTVTVVGTSGTASQSTTVSLQVTATTETYSVASNLTGGTMTVTQGQTGTANLTVSSTNGFVNNQSATVVPVTYSCSGLPAESACQFNGSASPVTTSATAITLNVITTAPTANASRGVNLFPAVLLPGLLGIVFVVGGRKRSWTGMGTGMRMLGLILVLGASTLWLGSCGGSSSGGGGGGNTGTPVGSSTVTVSATTGGAAPVTSSLQFTLTVNAAAK